MSGRNLRPVPPLPQDRPAASTDIQLIPRLAEWCEENDHDALALYNQALAAMQPRLNGMAGHYADNGIEEHGQAQAGGRQHFRVLMLCRLLTATNPKATAAADAFLDVAAAARGKVVIDAATRQRIDASLSVLAQKLAKENGEAVAAVVGALAGTDAEALKRAEEELLESIDHGFAALRLVRDMRGRL